MREKVTENNPLAVIRCTDETTPNSAKSKSTHLKKNIQDEEDNVMPGCNGGNHKGEHGTQMGIIQWRNMYSGGNHFKEGKNPNEGHLPTVVFVDMKHYRGPIWDEENPTHVPIMPIQRRCKPMCCTRRHIPLQIAWAKNIHSLQVRNASPTAKHQTPNAIQRILIHLGEWTYETLNPGLTYVEVSRATTIGDLGHITSITRK
jgi:hypothetical protein